MGEALTKISAIICTHNRAPLLRRAVDSLINQTLPPADYEVIIVDNASTDGTRDLAQQLARQAVNVRYVCEPELGLSSARNRGIEEARGEVVAFMDDDAAAEGAWLSSLLAAFDRERQPLACVGGKVLPVWETARPGWLADSLLPYLGLRDYGDTSRPCAFPEEFAIGCNMAFRRRDLLEGAATFDPLLGRRGGNLIGNEETAIQRRLHERGGVIFYEAAAVVHHLVASARLTRRWFIRRCFDQGVSDVLDAQLAGGQPSRVNPLKSIARNTLLLIPPALTINGQELAVRSTRVAYAAGALLQSLRGRRAAVAPPSNAGGREGSD
jgi:glycosyltransferase involved in cell wall biosynthesis